MNEYEDYDGLERPNRRLVSTSPKPRQNRTAWLILILLYMSGCSYWGWQVFLRPEPDPSPAITTETQSSLADEVAARTPSETTLMAATDLAPAGPPNLPPSAPISPNSKPASVNTKRPKRNGRPLDKMEAETGMIYETDEASSASMPGLEHADRDGLGAGTDASDPNERVDVDYSNDPEIAPDPTPKAAPPPILEAEPDLPPLCKSLKPSF